MAIVIHWHAALAEAADSFVGEPVVSAEHGLSDRTSEVGQRGAQKHRCYQVAFLLRKNDLCAPVPCVWPCSLCPLSSAALMLA